MTYETSQARCRQIDAHVRGTYFLLAPAVKRLKVGWSTDIAARLRMLAKVSPADLVLVGHCTENIEKQMHGALAQWRSHGEWFRATAQSMALVVDRVGFISLRISSADLPKGNPIYVDPEHPGFRSHALNVIPPATGACVRAHVADARTQSQRNDGGSRGR